MRIKIRPFKNTEKLEADIRVKGYPRKRIQIPDNVYCHIKDPKKREAQCIRWAEQYAIDMVKAPRIEDTGPIGITLDEFFRATYLDWIKGKAVLTQQSYQRHYHKYVKPRLGHKSIERVTAGDLDGVINAAHHLAKKTHAAIRTAMSSILDCAIRNDVIKIKPQLPEVNIGRRILDPGKKYNVAQQVSLIKAARALHQMLVVALHLGLDAAMRRGEVAALKWVNIDLTERTIFIKEGLAGGIEAKPKHGSQRIVFMTPDLHDALKALFLVRDKKNSYVLNRVQISEHSTRGVHKTGGISSASLNYWMRLVTEKAAGFDSTITKNSNYHRLRHSSGSAIAGESNNDIGAVRDYLGHASAATSEIYMHNENIGNAQKAMNQFAEKRRELLKVKPELVDINKKNSA